MSTHQTSAEGGCLCGAIRYQLAQQPARVTLCHCQFCQRSTGAAYMVQPACDEADFTVTQGQTKTYRHISAGSGKAIEIHFCDTCGTKIYQTFERFAGAVGLYSGTLDDPNWLKVTPEASKHIFLNTARADTLLPTKTPLFKEHAMTTDGAAIAPQVLDSPKPASEL